MAASDSKLSFARDTRPTWRTVLPTGYEPQKTHVPVGRFHAIDGYLPLFPDHVHLSVNDTGRRDPKVPVPYAALQVRAAHICQKLQPWKGLQIPAGISTWLARNKGGASDLNVRRGGTGLTPGLTSRTGNFFLGATNQGAGKGNHHETPFPAVSPNPGPSQHDHFIIRPCSILFLSESLVFCCPHLGSLSINRSLAKKKKKRNLSMARILVSHCSADEVSLGGRWALTGHAREVPTRSVGGQPRGPKRGRWNGRGKKAKLGLRDVAEA